MSFHLFPRTGQNSTYITDAAYNDQVSLLDVKTGKTSLLSTTVSTKFRARIRPGWIGGLFRRHGNRIGLRGACVGRAS